MKWSAVKWSAVKWSEVKGFWSTEEIEYFQEQGLQSCKWSEVQWSKVQWSAVKCSEVKWRGFELRKKSSISRNRVCKVVSEVKWSEVKEFWSTEEIDYWLESDKWNKKVKRSHCRAGQAQRVREELVSLTHLLQVLLVSESEWCIMFFFGILLIECCVLFCVMCVYCIVLYCIVLSCHHTPVGWGTALQTSRVRFPMVSLEFFVDIILLAALWPWGRLSL